MSRKRVLPSDRLASLQTRLAEFNRARAWRKFHAPKNLAMALAIEAGELMELFRWSTTAASWREARSESLAPRVREELADVVLVALSMANYLEIDLVAACEAKLARNAERYPVERARGRSDKYTAYAAAPPAAPGKATRSTSRGAR